MFKRFNITKEEFKTIRHETQWMPFLRKFELDKIFDGFPEGHFDKALELGCGSGEHSKHLESYCRKLTALEYNENRLVARSGEKTTFVTGDAQDLSRFSDEEMDLIFSSNLIEHLPNPDHCLAECRRVVKQEGLIIHTVPNRTWKIVSLLLYYPFQIKTVFRLMFSSNKSVKSSRSKAARLKIDGNLRLINGTCSLIKKIPRKLLPKVHGVSKSNLSEFKNWGEKCWINIFEKNGFEVVDIVRLPFYHQWGYNFRIVLRLGNYLGLSSSTAFFLKKIRKQ